MSKLNMFVNGRAESCHAMDAFELRRWLAVHLGVSPAAAVILYIGTRRACTTEDFDHTLQTAPGESPLVVTVLRNDDLVRVYKGQLCTERLLKDYQTNHNQTQPVACNYTLGAGGVVTLLPGYQEATNPYKEHVTARLVDPDMSVLMPISWVTRC